MTHSFVCCPSARAAHGEGAEAGAVATGAAKKLDGVGRRAAKLTGTKILSTRATRIGALVESVGPLIDVD